MSLREIGEVIGVSTGTVSWQLWSKRSERSN